MSKRCILASLALLVVAAGCGGGGGPTSPADPGTPGDPGQTTGEWTFSAGDASTLAVWSSSNNYVRISAVLHKNGNIDIVSAGGNNATMVGTTSGTVDADGNISTTSGSLRATGKVTHQSASLRVFKPNAPALVTSILTGTLAPESYCIYRGTWSGTYKLNDSVTHPLPLIVNEAGYVTGTISQGSAAGEVCGVVDTAARTLTMKVVPPSTTQSGWKLSGAIDVQASPNTASGTIESADLFNPQSGIWSITRL